MLYLSLASALFGLVSSNSIVPDIPRRSALSSDEACLMARSDSYEKYVENQRQYWPYFSDAAQSLFYQYNAGFCTCFTRVESGAQNVNIASYQARFTCPSYTSLQIVRGMFKPELNRQVDKAYCISVADKTYDIQPIRAMSSGCATLTSQNSQQGIVGWTTVKGEDYKFRGGGPIPISIDVKSLTVYLIRDRWQGKVATLRSVPNSGGVEWYPKTWRQGDTWKVCAQNQYNHPITVRAALIDNWLYEL